MMHFPLGLRDVNSSLSARRISVCLYSALHLITSSTRTDSLLQRTYYAESFCVPAVCYFKESCLIIQHGRCSV